MTVNDDDHEVRRSLRKNFHSISGHTGPLMSGRVVPHEWPSGQWRGTLRHLDHV